MSAAAFIAARAKPPESKSAVPKPAVAESGTDDSASEAKEQKILEAILKTLEGIAKGLDDRAAADDAQDKIDRAEMTQVGQIIGHLLTAVSQIGPAVAKWVEESAAHTDARLLAMHAELVALRGDVKALVKTEAAETD